MAKNSSIELIQGFLKELPVFKNLSEPHLNQLAKDFVTIQLKKEEIVFYQSDQSTDLYIVLAGSVRASLLNQEGQELILAAFNRGDFFGEMSLLDGMPRSATIIAAEDSTLAVLKRERFLVAVKNDPMIAIGLLSSMVQRFRTANGMIESLAFLDVSKRLIKLLLQIASTGSEKDRDGFLRIKKITHRELAARTGSSRAAISKVIKVLVFRGIVRENEQYFLISPKAEQEIY